MSKHEWIEPNPFQKLAIGTFNLAKAVVHYFHREPDLKVGDPENPYMLRWHVLPLNKWCNVYFHKFLRDDDDRALHDHPWASCSIILKGRYIEHMPAHIACPHGPLVRHIRRAGQIVFRVPEQMHRISLFKDQRQFSGPYIDPRLGVPCYTLFITGPWRRAWGFWCPQGWRPWREFVDPNNPGATGPGCATEEIPPVAV